MTPKTNERPVIPPAPATDWLELVRRSVEGLRFGSVQIIVHEGRVTQVESVEKTRFPACRDEQGRQS